MNSLVPIVLLGEEGGIYVPHPFAVNTDTTTIDSTTRALLLSYFSPWPLTEQTMMAIGDRLPINSCHLQ